MNKSRCQPKWLQISEKCYNCLNTQARKMFLVSITRFSGSHPSTIKTALIEAQSLTSDHGQMFVVADQPLYKVIVENIWAEPELFSNVYPKGRRASHKHEFLWVGD